MRTAMAAQVEHTSDAVIRAEGFSLKELFAHALWGMDEVLLPTYCGKATHYDCCMRVRLRAEDPTALLIDFLSEALTLTYIQKALFCHVYFDSLGEKQLDARLFGRWFRELQNEIKAVTWHEAHLTQNPAGKWATPVLFDL